jgi:hypothetical protein
MAPPAMMAPMAPVMAPPAPVMAPPIGYPVDPPAPVSPIVKTMSRKEMAHALGGEVTLLLVRLQDAKSVDLSKFVDANQLVRLAERQVCRISSVEDLADVKGFQKGDQVKARIFGDMITQNPNIYVLTNGFSWILEERIIPTLLSRVTTLYRVVEGGQTTETTTF